MAHVCVPWRGRGGNLGKCVHCGKDPILSNREKLNYKRMVELLGLIEDLVGCNSEFEQMERMVNQATETGYNQGLVIAHLAKRFDELKLEAVK